MLLKVQEVVELQQAFVESETVNEELNVAALKVSFALFPQQLPRVPSACENAIMLPVVLKQEAPAHAVEP